MEGAQDSLSLDMFAHVHEAQQRGGSLSQMHEAQPHPTLSAHSYSAPVSPHHQRRPQEVEPQRTPRQHPSDQSQPPLASTWHQSEAVSSAPLSRPPSGELEFGRQQAGRSLTIRTGAFKPTPPFSKTEGVTWGSLLAGKIIQAK